MKTRLSHAMLPLVIVFASVGCGGEATPGPAGDRLASADEAATGADEGTTGDAIAPDEALRAAAEAALVVGPTEADARRADEEMRALQASAADSPGDVDLSAAGWREDPYEGISR